MADIMKQYCDLGCLKFFFVNGDSFFLEIVQYSAHQVHGAQRMMKARVNSARINQVAKPELPDKPEPLKVRMFNQIEEQVTVDGDESIYRIVDDFLFIQVTNKIELYLVN